MSALARMMVRDALLAAFAVQRVEALREYSRTRAGRVAWMRVRTDGGGL